MATNRCNLQDTCKHGDVCESEIVNLTLFPACYDKTDADDLFGERRDPKKDELF